MDSSSSPSGSPPASVLGLGGLRISSDCSDGESDRELPSSATESDGSPVPSSQPAFPVQILPYLYLGCAKDSTNLDVLGKYGIKYILNVTPNLPNAFEHGGEFTYKQIPISDHWSQNLSQFFPEAISFIGKSSCAGAGGRCACRDVWGSGCHPCLAWVAVGLSRLVWSPACASLCQWVYRGPLCVTTVRPSGPSGPLIPGLSTAAGAAWTPLSRHLGFSGCAVWGSACSNVPALRPPTGLTGPASHLSRCFLRMGCHGASLGSGG